MIYYIRRDVPHVSKLPWLDLSSPEDCNGFICFIVVVNFTQPEQAANCEEIGPENDPANFLSVHLTNRYSVNMAKAQQTGRHSPPGDEKVRIYLMYLGQNYVKFTQQDGEYVLNQ